MNGMDHLQACCHSNVIYLLAKSLGTLRPGRSDSLLPAKRMPMGLIEYCVNFSMLHQYNRYSILQIFRCIIIKFLCRYRTLLTTALGWKPCTRFLAQSGVRFLLVPYGAMYPRNKLVWIKLINNIPVIQSRLVSFTLD